MSKKSNPNGKGSSNPGKSNSDSAQNKQIGRINERKIPDFKFTPPPPPPPVKNSSKSTNKND
jgi:hypothetical protein